MSAAQTEKRDLAKGSTKGQSEKTGKIFALTGGLLFVIRDHGPGAGQRQGPHDRHARVRRLHGRRRRPVGPGSQGLAEGLR